MHAKLAAIAVALTLTLGVVPAATPAVPRDSGTIEWVCRIPFLPQVCW